MFFRTLVAISVAALTLSVQAATERVALSGSNPGSTLTKLSTVAPQGRFVEVEVLRDFADTVTLGRDAQSGAALYPHRSVTLTYRVDCETSTLAMAEWQMFEGNSGQGQMIWNQENRDGLAFIPAVNPEMDTVLRSACATSTVAR
jgi:hypothetical protein